MYSIGVSSLTLSQSPQVLPAFTPTSLGSARSRHAMNRCSDSQWSKRSRVSPYTRHIVQGQITPASVQAVPWVAPGAPWAMG